MCYLDFSTLFRSVINEIYILLKSENLNKWEFLFNYLPPPATHFINYAGHESPSSASASVAAVVDSKPRLSSSVRQRVSEDDLLNKSRVEESLSRSVPPHQRAASAGTLPSTSYRLVL